jgi:excisionase family DNA binding protein
MKTRQNVQQNPNRIQDHQICPVSESQDKLLNLEQAAERLAVSLPTVRAWVWKKKIEVVRIGRCVRIREKMIRELISQNTFPAATPRQ